MTQMTFRNACLLGATIWGALFLTLLLVPGLVYWLFQVEGTPSASFLGRRAAMLFLGFATMAYMIRGTTDQIAQRAASAGVIASMGGLAILGTVEFFRGFAGFGIWLAILVEVGFVAIFTQYLRRG